MILILSIIENEYFRGLGKELSYLFNAKNENQLAWYFSELTGRNFSLVEKEKELYKQSFEAFAKEVISLSAI